MAGVNNDYDDLFDHWGRVFNVNPQLGKTLFHVESSGNPNTRDSSAGAGGGMQIMPKTARGLEITDSKDMNQAIPAAMRYIREGLDATGTAEGAAAYYNGGPKYSLNNPETAGYVAKMRALYPRMTVNSPTNAGEDILNSYKQKAAGQAATPDAAPPASDPLVSEGDAILRSFTKPAATEPPPPAPAAPAETEYTPPEAGPPGPSKTPYELGSQIRNEVAPVVQNAAGAVGDALTAVPQTSTAIPAVIDAAAQGFGTEPLGMGNKLVAGLRAAGIYGPAPGAGTPMQMINEGVLGPVGVAADAVLRAGGGLFRGGQEAVKQALGNGTLGRDVAALPEAFAGSPGQFAGSTAEQPAPPVNRLAPPEIASVRYPPPAIEGGTSLDRIRQLINHDEAVTGGMRDVPPDVANRLAPNGTDAPVPIAVSPPSDGGTRSVGAAASREGTDPSLLMEKTPAQKVTDLEKSVLQTAEERAGPQMQDPTPYVDNIPPRLLASSEFSPVNSLDEKVAIGQDPAFRAEVEANARDRNSGMVDLLRSDANDANAIDLAHQARSEVSPKALGVFDDQKPVDASGLVKTIQGYLDGEEGKQAAVRNTLKSVLDGLHDKDGNLETMPSLVYGARKNLTDLLKKGVKGTSDMADDVRASKHVLTSLLPQFDETISSGAPKFADEYLPQYHEMSKPIDQMEFLQKYQTGAKKITDGDGYLQPLKVQKMLDDILQGVKAPGVNPAKSLTDQQIQNIINVRNELMAGTLRDRLAKVKGSDSFQQINRALTPPDTPMVAGAKGAASLGAHALMLANPTTAGWGNALLGGYQQIVKPMIAGARIRRATEAVTARKAQLLTQNRLDPNQ